MDAFHRMAEAGVSVPICLKARVPARRDA